MDERHEIKELPDTGQHYSLDTHFPTTTPATLAASVLGFVQRAANASTANSSYFLLLTASMLVPTSMRCVLNCYEVLQALCL
jgi:hypothetical protein